MTRLGPDRCPGCQAEEKLTQAREALERHRATCADCAAYAAAPWRPRGSVGYPLFKTVPSCMVEHDLRQAIERIEHSDARRNNHHCQPHYCSFGPNCASYRSTNEHHRDPVTGIQHRIRYADDLGAVTLCTGADAGRFPIGIGVPDNPCLVCEPIVEQILLSRTLRV